LIFTEIALIPQPLLPRREKGSKSHFYIFLVPLSQEGRGARGEGSSITLLEAAYTNSRIRKVFQLRNGYAIS
jgi:hypothetical protein